MPYRTFASFDCSVAADRWVAAKLTICASVLVGVFALPQKIWAVLAATGIVLGAVYMLWLYQRTMFGKLDNPANEKLLDLNFREIVTVLPLIIMAFWIEWCSISF